MIKRNQKAEDKLRAKTDVKIKLPFILATISEKPNNQLLMRELHSQRLEMISNLPMRCYGDADVLGFMGFGEYKPKDIVEFLGNDFQQLPELFASCQKLIDSPSPLA
jgi:hypothetical protein